MREQGFEEAETREKRQVYNFVLYLDDDGISSF